MASVEVALATYNSERFLTEQLDSLFLQTYQDFTILVSDDGSTDSTLDIISDFECRYPGRIRRIDSGIRAGGAQSNFSRLVRHLSADYALFCDHDDVWLPDKILISLERIKSLEAQKGRSAALLVHTDLSVVGPNLEMLGKSFYRYQNVNPARTKFRHLLLANAVAGCASIVNRALYERARPIPPEAMMHDYWFAQVAATVGSIDYIPESTILYRQHEKNVIGAPPWGFRNIDRRVWRVLFGSHRHRNLDRLIRQASVLLSRLADDMTADQRELVSTLVNIFSCNRWIRFGKLCRRGILLNGFVRNVALCIVVTRANIGRESRLRKEPAPRREVQQ